MSVLIQPQRVMRSVLGHIAAHGLNGFKKEAAITLPLKEFILDASKPLPDLFRVHYWLYPYRAQVLLKFAAMMRLDGRPPVVFSLLKFCPMAFLVTIGEPLRNHFRLPNLHYLRDVPIDEKHEIILPRRPIPHRLWPENPGDNWMIAYHTDYAHLVKPLSRIVPP